EAHSGAAQSVCPSDVASGIELGSLGQAEVKRQVTVGLERGRRVHRQSFFAQVENHSAGDTIKTGKCRRVDFMAQSMPPVWSDSVARPLGRLRRNSIISGT